MPELLKQLSHSLMGLVKSQDDLQEVWEMFKDSERVPDIVKQEILRGLSIVTLVRLMVSIEFESAYRLTAKSLN
ncbi:hypothetical protein [Lactococcus lactis]|uniref:hypothetical protein n=1 Tax=Lactococcus lactis TaxID=1358 RepID=UPI0019141BDD|nr:hypothetical protein [Lactococcus lactis]WDA68722.1 hypothetical protein IL310_14555 [Lactococcus lactis]